MTETFVMSGIDRDGMPTVGLQLTCAVDLFANGGTEKPTHLLVLPMFDEFEPSRDLNTEPAEGGAVHWMGLIFSTVGDSLYISHERNDAEALLVFDYILGEELSKFRREFTAKAQESALSKTNGTELRRQVITASALFTTRLVIRLLHITMDKWRDTEWLNTDLS